MIDTLEEWRLLKSRLEEGAVSLMNVHELRRVFTECLGFTRILLPLYPMGHHASWAIHGSHETLCTKSL